MGFHLCVLLPPSLKGQCRAKVGPLVLPPLGEEHDKTNTVKTIVIRPRHCFEASRRTGPQLLFLVCSVVVVFRLLSQIVTSRQVTVGIGLMRICFTDGIERGVI